MLQNCDFIHIGSERAENKIAASKICLLIHEIKLLLVFAFAHNNRNYKVITKTNQNKTKQKKPQQNKNKEIRRISSHSKH